MADSKGPIEGPADRGGMFKPGDAASIPTKVYPDSSKIGKDVKSGAIDGPGRDSLYSK